MYITFLKPLYGSLINLFIFINKLVDKKLRGGMLQNSFFNFAIWEQFADTLDDIVLLLDKHRKIIYCNLAFAQTFFENSVIVVGQKLDKALKCIELDSNNSNKKCGKKNVCVKCGIQKAIKASEKNENVSENECLFIPNNSMELHNYKVKCLTINKSDNILLILSDQTYLKKKHITEKLFLHDISNLFTCIEAISEIMLIKNKKNGHVFQLADNLRSCTNEILEEIRIYKSISSIETEQEYVENKNINILTFFNSVVELISNNPIVKKRKIIVNNCDNSISIISSLTLLRRVVINLLINALNDSGNKDIITLDCKFRKNGYVILSVHNPGVMTSMTKQEVFNFQDTAQDAGRGFGLYSAKMLTENHLNGQLGFISEPDTGTTFYIILPVNVDMSSK